MYDPTGGKPMTISIRADVAADAPALAELAARTFSEAFLADNRPADMTLHLTRADGPSRQAKELAHPKMATLLAEVDAQRGGTDDSR